MANLEVIFQVPKAIEAGLASGRLERVGGVIVETASKQVVAWLREGNNPLGTVSAVSNVVGNLNPIGLLMNVAKIGAGLYDGHKTRDAVAQVGEAVNALQQTSNSILALTTFTMTGQVLNLALTSASFYMTMKRLDKLSEMIATLTEVVKQEFDYDRELNFRAALQAARDVFESEHPALRDATANDAINGLYKARDNFLDNFEETLANKTLNRQLLLSAQYDLIRAMYAETSRIRCYLEMNENNLAKQRLAESMPRFKADAEKLIHLWISKQHAIFFHKAFSSEDLDRFLKIKQWLMDGTTTRIDSISLFQMIDELRGDFWNSRLVDDGDPLKPIKKIARRPVKEFDDHVETLVDAITQAELVIENYQRLVGFELELRTMRLAFTEWNDLVPDEALQEYGMAMIVNTDILKRRS